MNLDGKKELFEVKEYMTFFKISIWMKVNYFQNMITVSNC